METDKKLNNELGDDQSEPPPDAYRVGYKKPPKHTQFRKGESGNPKGRPKGAKNLKTDFLEEMEEKIPVREGDGRRTVVTKRRAAMKSLMLKALKGDVRAFVALMSMDARFSPDVETDDAEAPVTNDEEQMLELLDELALRRKTGNQKKEPGDGKEQSES